MTCNIWTIHVNNVHGERKVTTTLRYCRSAWLAAVEQLAGQELGSYEIGTSELSLSAKTKWAGIRNGDLEWSMFNVYSRSRGYLELRSNVSLSWLTGIKGGKVPSVNRPCNPSARFPHTVQLYFQSHSINEKHLQSYQLVLNNAFQQVFSCCFLPLPWSAYSSRKSSPYLWSVRLQGWTEGSTQSRSWGTICIKLWRSSMSTGGSEERWRWGQGQGE